MGYLFVAIVAAIAGIFLGRLLAGTAPTNIDAILDDLDRLSTPPSWPTNPVRLPPRVSHTVPMLPVGPPDTTEGPELDRLPIDSSPAPVPTQAAHDAPTARGRSCSQPHIAKGQ